MIRFGVAIIYKTKAPKQKLQKPDPDKSVVF
jgi:hypothetical protein